MIRDITTIQIKLSTRERLKFFGKFGMTYDDVINDALDQLENAIDEHFEKTDENYIPGNDDEEEDEEEED